MFVVFLEFITKKPFLKYQWKNAKILNSSDKKSLTANNHIEPGIQLNVFYMLTFFLLSYAFAGEVDVCLLPSTRSKQIVQGCGAK